jgi:protoporphyrinogen IX oxidase
VAYFWFKAFHIVGVVVWFAGLFYLVRLFVYHAEAAEKPEPARTILREQYAIMEQRLYRMICHPGAVLAISMGVAMLLYEPSLLGYTWLRVKLGFVALLAAYHVACGVWLRGLVNGTSTIPASRFRLVNEGPTVLLVVMVLLAVFKDALPRSAATWAVVVLVVGLLAAIQLYARVRRRASLR